MNFTRTTLKNGMRAVLVPMRDNLAVTVLVMVEAGSKYETKEINGLSHFLEHMMFKGTTRRPKASDISRELDALGASYNAFTSQEYTGYYAKVEAEKLDKALDIVADLYMDPLLDEKEIEKEKGVIVEEIKMYQDLPHRDVHDVLSSLMFGDQPAGWSVLGTEANVRSFTRADLLDYRKSHYVASASTVVIAGSFDEKEALAKLEKIFGSMPVSKKTGKLPVVEKQTSPALKIKFKETDQTHVAIAWRTFSFFDKRLPIMMVLSVILGGGMSSRLFSKLRDELGICYYVNAGHNPSTDHGDLTISAGVDSTRVEEGICGILNECKRLRDEVVPEEELQKAKDHLAGSFMIDLETSDARAEYCGFQECLKRAIDSPTERLKKVKAVTAADVQKLAKEIFVKKGLNMAMIGRYDDESRFARLLDI